MMARVTGVALLFVTVVTLLLSCQARAQPTPASSPVPPPTGAPIAVPPPEGAATARELRSVGILFSPLPEVGLAVSREQAIETVLTHHFERTQLKGARPRPRIYQSVGAQYGVASEPGQNYEGRKAWLVTVVGMPPVRSGWRLPGEGESLYSVVVALVDAATGEHFSGGILTYSEGDAPR